MSRDTLTVDVHSQTCSRMQFIALAQFLTRPLLALIGRDWVVFPSRRVVLELVGKPEDAKLHQMIMFSVSPTLGLVDYPTVVDLGLGLDFCGWVGPDVDYCPSSSPGRHPRRIIMGCRFALACQHGCQFQSGFNYDVIDMTMMNTQSQCRGSHSVVAEIREPYLIDWYTTEVHNRRWGVIVPEGGTGEGRAMSLWNFDDIGVSGEVHHLKGMPLPWSPGLVSAVAFDGVDSLVFWVSHYPCPTIHELVVVDLQATWEQHQVFVESQSIDPHLEKCLGTMWCWRGVVYMMARDGLYCVRTGETTESHKGRVLEPLGGPYFTSESPMGCEREVYSVAEPTKRLSTHTIREQFGQELIVGYSGGGIQPAYIEVKDAVTGFAIFRMANTGGYSDSWIW
ncbi:hypothetical protein Pelo_16588 [Pelomyxa schiedti]|nr:hypothetical protein Pelo_16588 [Pelomyxa schiedti]